MDATLPAALRAYIHRADGLLTGRFGPGSAESRIPRRDTPTIAVEFVSGSRRDRQRDYVDKRQEYMAAGVAEYWIVDRFRRTLTVVRPGPDGPQDQVVAESENFMTPLLPGFELPLAGLLAVADRWAEKDA